MSGPVANNIFRASGVVAAAAGGLNWNSTILTALTTFTVTVNNPGVGNRYYIDGVQQQTLNLLEGFTYKFDQADSSNSGHPLRFSTTSGGTHGGGSEYTTGVTTSGTPGSAGAYTQIVVASGAPLLYYYCTNHNYMGGTANTVGETVEANRGYWIDTTSTTCTITLPSSPSKGDQIILVDYARTWGTNKITIDSNGSNYQGDPDTFTVEYSTNGEVLNIIYSDATKGWIPQDDDEVADVPSPPPTQRAIFGFGNTGSGNKVSVTNLVNSSGVAAADTTGVGSPRSGLAAAGYGVGLAIFGFGNLQGGSLTAVSNKVSSSGVVASDTGAVGTAREQLAAANYGVDKAIFGFGSITDMSNLSNLVSNSGVVASNTSGVGTARGDIAAAGYGGDKALFAYGDNAGVKGMTNLVSNLGVVASDTAAVSGAVARSACGGAGYGVGLAIFAYGTTGSFTNVSNKVNYEGVVQSSSTGVGTARTSIAAASYGGDKAIFGYGLKSGGYVNTRNLVSNTGVVAADATGAGTVRYDLTAAGYSITA